MTATASPADIGEVTIVRVFDAPRELVFACMTDPKHLTHFWGPTGVITPLGDGRTEVTIHQTDVPAMFRSPEAQAGFLTSLDRFGVYVALLARRR
jgi:hypothetical protein